MKIQLYVLFTANHSPSARRRHKHGAHGPRARAGCAMDRSDAASTSCPPRAQQCGCHNTHALVLTYHKTGTVLSRRLQEELESVCGLARTAWPAAPGLPYGLGQYGTPGPAPAGGRPPPCDTRRLCLDQYLEAAAAGGTLDAQAHNTHIAEPAFTARDFRQPKNSTFVRWLRRYLRPARARPLVHMIREPFALVISYYLHHRAGQERDRNPRYAHAWEVLQRAPPREGVLHVAKLALDGQLQLMAYNHRMLSERPDVLTMRMDSREDFDSRMRRFAAATGVGSACTRPGSPLLSAFARHDVARWTLQQRVANEHVNDAAREASEPWRNKTHLMAALEGSPRVAHRLRAIGAQLGYAYPGGVLAERR